MKKKIIALFLCLVGVISISCSQLAVFADDSQSQIIEELEQCVAEIDEMLTNYGTTAAEQLEDLGNQYYTAIQVMECKS